MDYQNMIYTKENGVATITLNRPQKRNAYTQELIDEMVAAIEDAKKDDEVRVLVITGAGRSFYAGYDLGGFVSIEEGRPAFH